jgi:hypothetical protein
MIFAQSSGNFSAAGYSPTCMINQSDGTFRGGTVGAPGTSSNCGMMSAPISVSPGRGNTLLIRPSLVTGLYTNTNLLSTNQKSSGIRYLASYFTWLRTVGKWAPAWLMTATFASVASRIPA